MQVFDDDGSGRIEAKELQDFVFEMTGDAISNKEIKKIVEAIDTDRSGDIDFEEFSIWWLCADKSQVCVGGWFALLSRQMHGECNIVLAACR